MKKKQKTRKQKHINLSSAESAHRVLKIKRSKCNVNIIVPKQYSKNMGSAGV